MIDITRALNELRARWNREAEALLVKADQEARVMGRARIARRLRARAAGKITCLHDLEKSLGLL